MYERALGVLPAPVIIRSGSPSHRTLLLKAVPRAETAFAPRCQGIAHLRRGEQVWSVPVREQVQQDGEGRSEGRSDSLQAHYDASGRMTRAGSGASPRSGMSQQHFSDTDRPATPELESFETPAALVDLDRVRANVSKVVAYLQSHGLAWRPHVKTHKSRTIAEIQLTEGAEGLTVATLQEAEAMAPLGADLLLAHPPIGRARQRRLTAFLEHHPLSVALDSLESAGTVGEAARAAGREVRVLLEVDVGMRRVGIGTSAGVVALAERVEAHPDLRFGGILFYPGHVRSPASGAHGALSEVSDRVDSVLEALGGAGLSAGIVSGGSTPTLWDSHRIRGMTEVRAGTCVFHDRDTLGLGVCDEGDIAYSVLATVVSTAVPGQAVMDAGSKALSREELRSGGTGLGVVVEHPEVVVDRVSEEHGILDLSSSSWRPKVGDRIRIVPNHVCVSVNLQDRLLAPDGSGVREIPLEGRGRGQ
jgi:D-serine deaminase-like pyridoxal phosphate-dependent protein